ncbi:MAG TPA: RNA polymerase sigma-70 factor, partial [Puia sp.]|nr:RNA polymerase sigma-70 factor [Puia sp.]
EKVWRSIQQKDGQAFENFYREHYRFFLLAACKYLRDAGPAQEIVNDVFIKLWEEAETIHIETSLKFYVHRAVVNRCLNVLDREKRDRERQRGLIHLPQEVSESREMEDDELKIRLYQAIDRLPEQCRKVFRMSRFEELKQREIADKLGISIKTVKNHITYALKHLNVVLGDWNRLPAWIGLINYFFWPHR